jgi:hypothetical protein
VSNIDFFATKNKGLAQNANKRITFSCQDRANGWHTIGTYANVLKVDGVTKATSDTPTGTTPFTNTLFLLQNNKDGQPENNNNAYRCYVKDARIWDENNVLVRDYIPAYNESTKRYGLYDNVEHKFYDSANGVPFEGPKPHDAGLPQEYTQVDFIKFLRSKQNVIMFNETIHSTDCFESEWQYTFTNTQMRALGYNNDFTVYISGSSCYAHNYHSTLAEWISTNIPATCSRNSVKFDGLNKVVSMTVNKGVAYTKNLTSTTFEASSWAITRDQNGNYADMHLFHVKRYVDGVLYRDLIPCRRDSDGVYGLYDIVQNSFHTSNTALGGGNIED